jgi:hypothetical protein
VDFLKEENWERLDAKLVSAVGLIMSVVGALGRISLSSA